MPEIGLGIGVLISERSQFYFAARAVKQDQGIRTTVAIEINREGRRASKLAQL